LHTAAHTLRRYELLKQACIWAGNAGLKVLIDLHGAPGSQNGFDHSGRKRARQGWTDKRSNIDRTLAIISTMAQEFSQDKYRSSVAAIELLNEPNGMNLDVLKQVRHTCCSATLPRADTLQFYRDGYGRVRQHSSDIAVVLSPGFTDPSSGRAWRDNWSRFLTAADGGQNVIEDAHPYTIFSMGQIRMKAQDRQNVYCGKRGAYRDANRNSKWLVVGEVSRGESDVRRRTCSSPPTRSGRPRSPTAPSTSTAAASAAATTARTPMRRARSTAAAAPSAAPPRAGAPATSACWRACGACSATPSQSATVAHRQL